MTEKTQCSPEGAPNEKPLEGWKEIANHLSRTERTVKRWEKEGGLPVHRHLHQARSSVYAYRKELDAWWAQRRPGEGAAAAGWLWRRPTRVLAFVGMLLLALLSAGGGGRLGPASVAAQAQGIDIRQVWTGSDVDILGGASPDGRYLSYVDWDTGDLAIRDLAAGTNRRLTNKGTWQDSDEFAEGSVISHDGKQVAYAWYNKDGFYELRTIGTDGSQPRVVYRNPEVSYLVPAAWSPDAKSILAAFERKDRDHEIVLVSVADGTARLLKSLDWRWPEGMSLSPDGRYVVYDFQVKEESENHDIYLLATDGSREIPLVQHPANDLNPMWAPDGKTVVFMSDRTGTMGLWAIQVADGNAQGAPELLKRDMGPATPLGFSRSGSYFYGVSLAPRDVYVASLDLATGNLLEAPRRLTERFVGSNSSPEWSPDGNSIVYTSQRGPSPWSDWGSRVIVIRSVKTGEERELSPPLSYFPSSHPRWSPDGRSLLVDAFDPKGRRGIQQIDAQTGRVTSIVISAPRQLRFYPVWSPDGKSIFYCQDDGKRSRILKRELGTGDEKEIYSGPAYSVRDLALAPDGSKLAFLDKTVQPGGTIKVASTSSGEVRELFRFERRALAEDRGARFAWTPDGRGVVFIRRRGTSPKDNQSELWRVPAEGGKPLKLGLAMEGLSDLSLHPDGQRIAVTVGANRAQVWEMENLLPTLKAAK